MRKLLEFPFTSVAVVFAVVVVIAALVGNIGLAQTALSPQGKVFVHGELWDAVSSANVPAGQPVVVRNVDGLQLRVDPAPAFEHAAAPAPL